MHFVITVQVGASKLHLFEFVFTVSCFYLSTL